MMNLNNSLESKLDIMKTESIEYHFTMYSNITKIHNTKNKVVESMSDIDYYMKWTERDKKSIKNYKKKKQLLERMKGSL